MIDQGPTLLRLYRIIDELGSMSNNWDVTPDGVRVYPVENAAARGAIGRAVEYLIDATDIVSGATDEEGQ